MRGTLIIAGLLAAAACGSRTSSGAADAGAGDAAFDAGPDASRDAGAPDAGASDAAASNDAGSDGGGDGGAADASADAGGADAGPGWVDTLDSNRNRLIGTYLAFLKAFATSPQTNGLSGSNVSSVCDVWSGLDPSARGVFLTLTARLQGSTLGVDGSSMLWHVTGLYRVAGGQGATATSPGSCGGGEYNRMIMSQDPTLHDAQRAASQHQGALQPNGKYDLADAPTGTFWRDSHDVGGPHSPFDLSDETDKGAPRGQTQYFADPTSAAAKAPLGRQDLAALVDPLALEMDQDYDCAHNSNPACSYVFYGPLCTPAASKLGTDIYVQSYGSIDASFKPAGCP